MCGRYTLRTPAADWAPTFDVEPPADVQLRFNIAPTQEAPIVRLDAEGRRQALLARWGLIPSWADDPSIGSRMINARCETAATLPAFRQAYERRRCLVPADGFYEWKSENKRKQPYYVRRRDGRPWAFAGLWESWRRDELRITSFTILTTDANAELQSLHGRMPVILHLADYQRWLAGDAASRAALLAPFPYAELTHYAVSPAVNRAAYDAPDCLQPAVVEAPKLLF